MDFSYPTRPLTDFAKLRSGGTPSKAKQEFWNGDIPWITPKDMGYWDGSTINHVTAEAIGNGTRLAPPRTSYIAVRGMSLHKEIRVIRVPFPATFNQDIKAVEAFDGVNNRFLYYCLVAHKPTLLEKVESAGHGTGRLPTDQLERLPIPDVEEDVSVAIAEILSNIDGKIELLRDMNRSLEEIARAVFRAWVVDFEPIRAKAAGATVFRGMPQELFETLPNSFEPSGTGEIPTGWTVKPLDEIADFLNGLAMQKHRPKEGEDWLPVIKISELRKGITEKTERASESIPDKYKVFDGDFIFSWSGSLLAKFWTAGDGALNQHLFKVTSGTHPIWFVSGWIWHHLDEFQRIAAGKATTMGHIQRGHLSEASVVVPSDDQLLAMTQILSPLIERQICNDLEARNLASLRDTLLPKLISGELEAPSLEALGLAGVE